MSELLGFIAGAGLALLGSYGVQRLIGGGGRKLADELKRHFGADVKGLPIVSRSFATVDLPNLELSIDHYVRANLASSRVIGYTSLFGNFQNELRSLIGNDHFFQRATVSAAQYREVDVDVDLI